jgi:hypothetical protein
MLNSIGCINARYTPNLGSINIASFQASPIIITAGQSAELSWSETGAVNLSISDGSNTLAPSSLTPVATNSVSVTPTATTTYTLTGIDVHGVKMTSTATVSVVPPPVVNTNIDGGFWTDTPTFGAGGSTTINWNISSAYAYIAQCSTNPLGGTQCPINGALYVPTGADGNGSYAINPITNTTYTLYAINAAGLPNPAGLSSSTLTPPSTLQSASGIAAGTYVVPPLTIDVTVIPAPKITLLAAPPSIPLPVNDVQNGHSTLTWTINGKWTTVSISDNIDNSVLDETSYASITGSGSITVSPLQTTTYTLTSTYTEWGVTAKAQSTATVTVSADVAPFIASFSSTPVSGPSGGPFTLNWSVDDATTVSIECLNPGCTFNGSGPNIPAAVTGNSIAITPTASTSYELIANNATGSTTAVTKVVVGEVTDFAGSLTESGYLNGADLAAYFNSPAGITMDIAGNFYVADRSNNLIRMITPSGQVTSYAGNPGIEAGNPNSFGTGTPGTAGSIDGGLVPCVNGSCAEFNEPQGVVFDPVSGNLFVADTQNSTIRMITPGSTGQVTTIAGNSTALGQAGGGNLYADGACANALFTLPTSIAIDPAGNLYVADGGTNGLVSSANNNIRMITSPSLPSCNVCTLAGYTSLDLGGGTYCNPNGTNSPIGTLVLDSSPGLTGLVVDGNLNVYVGDMVDHQIFKITSGGIVSTYAGTGASGHTDGTGITATFNSPQGLALDQQGNLYVADEPNYAIRRIAPTPDGSGVNVSTIIGDPGTQTQIFVNNSPLPGHIPEPLQIVVDTNSCNVDPNCGSLFFTEVNSQILSAPY